MSCKYQRCLYSVVYNIASWTGLYRWCAVLTIGQQEKWFEKCGMCPVGSKSCKYQQCLYSIVCNIASWTVLYQGSVVLTICQQEQWFEVAVWLVLIPDTYVKRWIKPSTYTICNGISRDLCELGMSRFCWRITLKNIFFHWQVFHIPNAVVNLSCYVFIVWIFILEWIREMQYDSGFVDKSGKMGECGWVSGRHFKPSTYTVCNWMSRELVNDVKEHGLLFDMCFRFLTPSLICSMLSLSQDFYSGRMNVGDAIWFWVFGWVGDMST